jgi:predicted metal-dependent enzyme (double-stranded beta helix superfamily)
MVKQKDTLHCTPHQSNTILVINNESTLFPEVRLYLRLLLHHRHLLEFRIQHNTPSHTPQNLIHFLFQIISKHHLTVGGSHFGADTGLPV